MIGYRCIIKTRKFYWTLDDIRIEKISRFLEYHGPYLEFDSRSLSYSTPKKGISGVIGERNSMQSTDMKHQFNKIFPL